MPLKGDDVEAIAMYHKFQTNFIWPRLMLS